ncbi:MAG: RHS repeat protein, partial [Burkholderiales bacterium]|nr:RHS repeat protein [Burkholderiales bacterium]
MKCNLATNSSPLLNNNSFEPFELINGGAWANGAVYKKTYDAQGRITGTGDRNTRHTTIEYNAQGQRSQVKDAKGNLALVFTYNPEGLLETVADHTG